MKQNDSLNSGQFTTLGRYYPNLFLVKTWFSQEELRLGKPDNPSFERYWYVWPTIIHEWIHHLQFIGTTYGRLHHYLGAYIGPIVCPIIRSMLADDTCEVSRPLLRSFLSRVPDPVPHAIMAAADASLIARGFMGTWSKKIPDTARHIRAPEGEVSPRVRISGKMVSIGGKEVLEAHARLNEVRLLRNLLSKQTFEKVRPQLDKPAYYWAVAKYVESELSSTNSSLVRILCDIALNPDWLREGKIEWEIIHPGWRLVKLVTILSRDPKLLNRIVRNRDFSSTGLGHAIEREVTTAAGWKRPTELLEKTRQEFPWYTNDVVSLRSTHPLAFALPIENMERLVSKFPVELDFYTPYQTDSPFETPPREELEFEYLRMYSILGTITFPEMMSQTSITCPFHDTKFATKATCPTNCPFPRYFERVFKISIERYLEIPAT